jgi:hypothetical protein
MTRDELVRAVIADPDATAPREAFAQWGLGAKDPQGELTWLQLAERRERRTGTAEAAIRAGSAAYALILKHGAAWSRPVLAMGSSPQFFRGFVEAVTLDAPTFLLRAAELYAIAPIRSINFVDAAADIEAILASPHIARLVALQFTNRSGASALGDAGLRAIAASPNLSKLAILHLPANKIGRPGIEALAASKGLPNLRYATVGDDRDDSPVEDYGIDGINGEINNDSIALPAFGRELEAKYGRLRWLHTPSESRFYPPDERDF